MYTYQQTRILDAKAALDQAAADAAAAAAKQTAAAKQEKNAPPDGVKTPAPQQVPVL
jgi:hypothetical protein